jgi:hypothetical protein
MGWRFAPQCCVKCIFEQKKKKTNILSPFSKVTPDASIYVNKKEMKLKVSFPYHKGSPAT